MVLILGYNCNNSCLFCLNSNKRNLIEKTTTEEAIRELAAVRKKGFTYVELIGGEPTIRSDIFQLISFARKLEFKTIMMVTNGRLFSYKDFSKKIIEAGLTDLIFSIHGYNSRLHDSLTQAKGSFNQIMKGIKNVRALGLKSLGTNTTIVKQNYRDLEKIGRLFLKLGFDNSEFIFADPTYGAVHDNFKRLMPKISQAAPFIHKLLNLGKGKTRHWCIRYVPLCYFQNYLDQISELNESKYFDTQHSASDFVNLDVERARKEISRIKPSKCKDCELFGQCEGIWKEYYKYYGDKELRPVINDS